MYFVAYSVYSPSMGCNSSAKQIMPAELPEGV